MTVAAAPSGRDCLPGPARRSRQGRGARRHGRDGRRRRRSPPRPRA